MKSILILFFILTGASQGSTVTLTTESRDGTNGVAELSINQYEVAEVVSFPRSINGEVAHFEIIKDGRRLTHFVPPLRDPAGHFDPVIVAGPATLRLSAINNGGTVMCTIRVSPEAFPPDRTILLPPGANQARITLELSTNLVQWFAATNGIYGPLPEAKFFRIKLDPVN